MLLLFLLVHHVLSRDFPKQTNYITKQIDSCPDVGYFFRRELGKSSHPGTCYLCFCRENNTAVCWPRDNKRCDVEHYHHHGVGKRDARPRRSPVGLSDIFFRDAARDVTVPSIAQQQCNPSESYSVGCPPADWCVGCTVCDCDAHGHWDCHTLNFCPEKPKKKAKKNLHRGPHKRKVYRRRAKPSTNTINNTDKSKYTGKMTKSSPVKRQTKKMQVTPIKKGPQVTKNQPARKNPQIKKTPPNKRNPQIIRNASGKRSQEIKKTAIVKRNQLVNKNKVQKSSQVKKKVTPTKIPTRKKGTAKKSTPLKTNLPAKKAQLEKRSSTTKMNAVQKNQLKAKRSSQPQQIVPKEVKLTRRPPIVKSKVMPLKTTKKPTTKLTTTTQKPSVVPEMNPEILGKELVRKFMSVLQKPQNKEETTVKSVTINTVQTTDKKLSTLNENVGQDVVNTFMSAFQNIIKKNIQQRLDSVKKRTKRQDVNLGSMELLNKMSLINRFKRNINFTNLVESENSPFSSPVEIITVNPNSSNVFAYNYYMYSDNYTASNKTSDNYETYGYTIDASSKNSTAKRSVQIPNENNSTEILNTETTLQYTNTAYRTTLPMSVVHNKTSMERKVSPMDNLNDANDLKFNKWSQVKTLKNKDQNLRIALERNTTALAPFPKYSEVTTDLNKKLHSSKLARKIGTVQRKYKLKKVVSTLNNRTRKIEKNNLNPFKAPYIKAKTNESKVHEFRTFVTNVKNGFGKRNESKIKKANKFKIIKYLQRIFKKMFSTRKQTRGKKNNRAKIINLNKDSVLETLCESFGPCYINRNNNVWLENKIENLSKETNRMLRTIKTIKGLLKLVDIAKYDKYLRNTSKILKPSLKSDIQKLSAILKGTYDKEENMEKLTQTQLTHIDYIKKNTQMFIQTSGKFAKILNEIIDDIGTTENNKDKTRRMSRFAITEEDPKSRNPVTNTPFETMKDLLLKYNLLQNKFINKMYKVLANIQSPKAKPIMIQSNERKPNSTAAIHTYTKNIIKNLRKLKSLAQTLSSGRKRRDLRDEDSMEYLLVLMEYLLNKNYPLDAAPVNDGIDLLIEAIKHAPDIRQVKKKILESTPMTTSNVTNYTSTNSTELNASSEDSASNGIKMSKEDNYTSTQDNTKVNAIEESVDNDSEDYNKYMSHRKAIIESTTEIDYYTKYNVVKLTTEKAEKETTKSFIPIELPKELKLDKEEKSSDGNLDKTASSDNKDDPYMKIDIFDADNEETAIVVITTTTESDSEADLSSSSTTNPVTEAEILFATEKVPHYEKEDVSASRSVNKKYMDWLDESFEEEVKAEGNATEATKRRAIPQNSQKCLENVSSFTKESNENNKKRIDSGELIYKKEMNLLNSLDYGGMKSDLDNSDSKEVSDDKYSDDTFADDFL